MGWESRGKGSGRYFYRSVRLPGGAVVKEYHGGGAAAQKAAEALEEGKARRLVAALQQTRVEDAVRATQEIAGFAELLLEATLYLAGYHRPNYGPWRRKRGRGCEGGDAPAGIPGGGGGGSVAGAEG